MSSAALPIALHLSRSNSVLNQVLLVLAASLCLTLSAKIQVPFWPVPMTMQTYMVIVLGMALGPRLGPAAVLAYLAQGAMGLPVFAGTPEKGIGLAYMMGPTGAYLLGFVLAAVIAGQCAARGFDRHWSSALLVATVATAAIFICGFAWLSTLIGVDKAIEFGVMPFLLGALLKIVLAMLTLPFAWKLFGDKRGKGTSSNA